MILKHPFFQCIVMLLVIGLKNEPSAGQSTQILIAPDTGESIMRSVIAKTKENEVVKKDLLTYKRVYTLDNLNDSGQVTDRKKQEVTSIDFGGKEETVEVNGKPVKRAKSTSPRFNLINVFDAILKLDDFNIIRIDKLGDRHFYVINFKPKPGAKPNDDIENVIVRSEGELYIDIETFYIKRLSARLVRSYERAWGMFSLARANVEMEFQDFDNINVVKSVTLIDKYWVILKGDTFEKQVFVYQGYQRKS